MHKGNVFYKEGLGYEKVPCWSLSIVKYILFCWFIIPVVVFLSVIYACWFVFAGIALLWNAGKFDRDFIDDIEKAIKWTVGPVLIDIPKFDKDGSRSYE